MTKIPEQNQNMKKFSRSASSVGVGNVIIFTSTEMANLSVVTIVSEGKMCMEWNEFIRQVAELALDIKDIEDEIAGLYNLKKEKKAEIKRLNDLMVEQCRRSGMEREE